MRRSGGAVAFAHAVEDAAPCSAPIRCLERRVPAAEPAPRGAAAAADRRADAARRAGGELLVPAPPRRLRVDRGAGRRAAGRRHGLRRGLRLQRAGRRRRRAWSASTPTRRPTSTRGCATCAPTCASSATWSRASPSPATPSSSCRRSSTSRTPGAILEHFKSMLAPGGVAFVSTPNLLTLAPPGAEKSDNPWHVHEYRAEEFRELCEAHFAAGRAPRPLPRPQAARPRARDQARLGLGPQAPRPDQALLRPLHAGDRRLRLRAQEREPRRGAGLPRRLPCLSASAPATWRSSCTPTCPTSRASGPTRSARSGCSTR